MMNAQLQRALLLFDQSRYELAEPELRQALAADPHDAFAHSLLALCLAHREHFEEATQEARQGVHLAPDFAFTHYALADVLHDRRDMREAYQTIQEAIRLDPSEANHFALLSQIHLDERQWPGALAAAEQGLEQNPEHVACTNLRAIALVRLGRKEEAGATIDAALARNPENSVTHANQGWTLIERGDYPKALEHFRESLRLNPDNEWARQGIIEALKSRNIVYALMLRYFLWMSKLSGQVQWAIILGGYFGNHLLSNVARSHPDWAPWILPVQVVYLAFAVLTWTANPLFNLLLRLNRFGRLVLSAEQTLAANLVGACLFTSLAFLVAGLLVGIRLPLLIGALVSGVLMIPVSGTFSCPSGWPRNIMALYTGALTLLGAVGVACGLIAMGMSEKSADILDNLQMLLLSFFVLGAILSQWLANFLVLQRPKR